jgi:hypothetical protein
MLMQIQRAADLQVKVLRTMILEVGVLTHCRCLKKPA